MARFWPHRYVRLRRWLVLLAALAVGAGAVPLVAPPAAATASSKADRAINWMLARRGTTAYQGRCERAVENAFGTSGRYPTARANWTARVRFGQARTPAAAAPRGALVFYSTSRRGHVAISLGGGKVVSTSVHGRIGVAPIAYFQHPLGWARAPW